jgi:hypothetical protein
MRRRAQTARNSADSSTTVRVRNSADLVMGNTEDAEWRDVFHFPYGEEGGLVDFCAGGGTAYLTSSLERETTALLMVDLATGETLETLYSNDRCNVGGVTLDRDTKELQMISTNYARTVRVGGTSNVLLFFCILTLFASGFDDSPPPAAAAALVFSDPLRLPRITLILQERVFFDEDLERDYQFLKSTNPNAEIGVASRSLDETKWIVAYSRSDGPTEYVVYDKPNRVVTPLFVSNPKLLPYQFSLMEDV